MRRLCAVLLACALGACGLPLGTSGTLSHGYEHSQIFENRMPRVSKRAPRMPREDSGAKAKALPGATERNLSAAHLGPQDLGTAGLRAELWVHPSGSRGLTFGVDVGWPGARCGYAGGLAVQGALGWSLMPLPDESVAGAELLAIAGGGGLGAPDRCEQGFFAGARLGMPLRLSASRPAFALDADPNTTPLWYLVPEFDLVRYFSPVAGSDASSAFGFSIMLGLRVFFWSRVEP